MLTAGAAADTVSDVAEILATMLPPGQLGAVAGAVTKHGATRST
jgi:hypothetical protein